ncbi:MAG: amino acid ABC transporter permease [Acidimicrobiia bacterium]|nr:amino acid ABC transporter permease [Acidimicrobiia bacterium]
MTESTITAPPAAAERLRATRPQVRTRLGSSVVSLAVAVAVVGLTWWSLFAFRASFADGAPWPVTVAVVALAAAALAVPAAGVLAVRAALRARSLDRARQHAAARVAAARARDMHWYVLGFGLTALVVAFLTFLIGTNDGSVREVFFRWDITKKSFRGLAAAFWLNIKIFTATEVLVLVWALLVAVVRRIPGRAGAPIRFLAVAYVDVFRGLPAILVLTLVVFGFQLAKLPGLSLLAPEQQLFWLVVLALTLVYGAYVAEVYRAGMDSIHWSQSAAARSLGLSQGQTLRYVIIPQGVRRMVPPLLNDFIGLQKDTALASVVGTVEVFNKANLYKSQFFNLTAVAVAGLLFLIMTIPLARFTDWLIRRDQQRMQVG